MPPTAVNTSDPQLLADLDHEPQDRLAHVQRILDDFDKRLTPDDRACMNTEHLCDSGRA